MQVEDKKEYMTFKSGRSLYAVPIENVLTINGIPDELHCRSFGQGGVLGVVEYLAMPVVVFDFSQATSMKSSMEEKAELVEILKRREQDHIDWLNALEQSIVEGTDFEKARDPGKCVFGLWYDKFETEDEDLQEIMADFDKPHKAIHALADQLLDMCKNGEKEKSLKILEYERKTTLTKLRNLFNKARDQLSGSIKPILIYLTLDGKQSHIALKVDEIANVEEVKPENLVAYDDIGLPHFDKTRQFIEAYMTLESGQECLLINPDKILTNKELSAVAEAV